MREERERLRRNLNDHFSVAELRSICFDLGLDYDVLEGDAKEVKIVELVRYLERRDRVGDLVQVGKRERPHLSWDYTPAAQGELPQSRTVRRPVPRRAILVGLVVAMLIVAAGTQSMWGGALTMFAFGLGTVPTLLGFGLAATMLSPRLRGRLQYIAAILILVFALQTILRGLAAANVIPSLIIGPVMLW